MPTALNFIKSSVDSIEEKITFEAKPKDATMMEGIYYFLKTIDPKIHRLMAYLPDGLQHNDMLNQFDAIEKLTNKVI